MKKFGTFGRDIIGVVIAAAAAVICAIIDAVMKEDDMDEPWGQ